MLGVAGVHVQRSATQCNAVQRPHEECSVLWRQLGVSRSTCYFCMGIVYAFIDSITLRSSPVNLDTKVTGQGFSLVQPIKA